MILHIYYYCDVKKMILHIYYYYGVKKMILHAYYYYGVKNMILHAYYYCDVKKSKALGMIPATLQSNFFTICVFFFCISFSQKVLATNSAPV